MEEFAEIRAKAAYFLARKVGERIIPPVKLVVSGPVTLQEAQSTDDFRQRAIKFHAVYKASRDPDEKADALIGLSQDLINIGRFGQAREFLSPPHTDFLAGEIPQPRKLFYEAVVLEKLGWIADYETGYRESLRLFEEARNKLLELEQRRNGQLLDDEEDYLSATTHFIGRARFGLASQGINRVLNCDSAIAWFSQDLVHFERLRSQGKPAPANEGFQYAWIARCKILLKDYGSAENYTKGAGRLFREFTQQHPESGVMAHYYLLRGRISLDQGLLQHAEQQFREALRIRQEVEVYPKGYADAAVGLALVSFKKGQISQALSYGFDAIKNYPLILAQGIFGG